MADTDAELASGAVATAATPHMTLVDWLDDLTVRFLLNLPPNELSSIPRLCFQVEEAQWFYEDFVRPQHPTFPSLNLKQFLMTLFQHCPLLSGFDVAQHGAAYEEFLAYKTRVPVRGAILMDDSMDKVLLVRGWKKGASWSFPRGKINKDEADLDCAIREVYEETGYDVTAAGLVKSNLQPDGEVKSIDVTMRDQNMKLFVFRGVPLETYFEPRTRKEISKISWYNVKDLPGFKKQKGASGHGHGAAQTSKFYMVAPFLGELKKWVGQQRRNDNAVARARHNRDTSTSDIPQVGVTEDEGDTEQEFTTDNGLETVDQSADELKRLLSIGRAPVPAQAEQEQPEQAQGSGHATNLLAILKGNQHSPAASALPHTPLEQVDPRIPSKQPETPHPHYSRHPSIGFQHQQAVPPFPYSPHRLLQQQQEQAQVNFGTPPTNAFEHSPGYFGKAQATLPPHMQQLQQPQVQKHNGQYSLASIPPRQDISPQFSNQANAAASSLHLYQQLQTPDLDGSQVPAQHFPANKQSFTGPAAPLASPMPFTDSIQPHGPALVHAMQNSQVPLGSERSIPEPSKLPAPKLNAHSLKLLDVFKGAGTTKPATSGPARAETGQRSGSQQQAALLDLFKKPAVVQTTSKPNVIDNPLLPEPVSPALTDTTVMPISRPAEERPSTLNETTRKLPPNTKGNSPIPSAPSGRPAAMARPTQHDQYPQPPRSKQTPQSVQETYVRHVSRSEQPMRSSIPEEVMAERPKSRRQLYDPSNPQKFTRTLSQGQRLEAEAGNPQRQASRQSPRSPNPASKAKPKGVSTENGNAVPQFSILQRPGSSSGKGPRSPAPQSPLRYEAPRSAFQPQVLRRQSSAENGTSRVNEPTNNLMSANTGDEKKGHLLSLFSKNSAATATPSTQVYASTSVTSDLQIDDQKKKKLLGLFSNAPRAAIKTPEPPPAPQLFPEQKPPSQCQQPVGVQQNSQQLLLNLFNKSSPGGAVSPGTPISPFTLNSPAAMSVPTPDPMSKLGSVASIVSNGGGSGQQTPTSATPTLEAKGFLLDYLNGVVQKEGYRGAKRL